MSASSASSNPRRLLRLFVRVAVAASLTGYLLWRSDPAAVWAAVANARWWPIAGAVALTLADRTLMAYRWVVLLCTVDEHRRPPLPSVLRVFFISTFVGTFLPSIGGDALRAYGIAKLDVPGGSAIASVFLDRMFGVASILLMATAGLWFARDLLDNRAIVLSLVATAGICLATLLVIFSRPVQRLAGACLVAAGRGRLRRMAETLLAALGDYARHPRQLLNVLAGSVAVQILRILQAYLLGRGLGIDAPLAVYFGFLPLILLVMLLPITINGIGTSQAAFVWFFVRAGVSPAAAFTLSVLFVALGIVGNLPGALLYLTGNDLPAAQPAEPADAPQ